MRVYVNRLPVCGPWGGGNAFVKSAYELVPGLGHEVIPADKSTVAPDVMLLVGIDNDGNGISAEQAVMYKSIMEGRRNVKLILRVNECDARKGTVGVDETLLALSNHMDGTVFVSGWLQEYFEKKGWGCTNNIIIKNGVDREVFKPGIKLNNGKVNLVAHHWSAHEMKGADIYEELDRWIGTPEGSDFTFTYIGRHNCNFKNTTVIRPLSGKRLGEELGKYDVYVSGSRWDPGPNHVTEALACGLPTYVHRDGGGCVEFAGKNAVYDDFGMLKVLLHTRREIRADSLTYMNTWMPDDWATCIKQCTVFLENTWNLNKNI